MLKVVETKRHSSLKIGSGVFKVEKAFFGMKKFPKEK